MVKDPFLGQDKLIVFNVAEYEKLIDLVSDSTLQMTFKKYHLSSFLIVSKKNIHNYLKGYKYTLPFPRYIFG